MEAAAAAFTTTLDGAAVAGVASGGIGPKAEMGNPEVTVAEVCGGITAAALVILVVSGEPPFNFNSLFPLLPAVSYPSSS